MKLCVYLCVLLCTAVALADGINLYELQRRKVRERWTFDVQEFAGRPTGLVKPDEKILKAMPRLEIKGDVVVPDRLDLRETGKLTQVEDQGNCGSCWAFSLIASLRDGLALMDADPGRLSQQYLVSCSKYSYGCSGGFFNSANDLVAPKGAPLWSAFPYMASNARCQTHPVAASIKGWAMLGEDQVTTEDIVRYMAIYHFPVSITVSASGAWNNYASGVYGGSACTTRTTNHMINIVGYDLEGEKFDRSGSLPAGKGVWILRNSWGKEWGEQGFMRSKITSPSGRRCNNVAEDAAVFEFNEPGPGPTPTPEPTITPTPTPEPTPTPTPGPVPPDPTPGPVVRFFIWLWNGIVYVVQLIVNVF